MRIQRILTALPLIGALGLAGFVPAANAIQIRVSQETAAGLGNFDANILGFINPFDVSGLTPAQFYSYGNPDNASYNGQDHGGPDTISSTTQLFFADTSGGLAFVGVHDRTQPDGDTGGGSAQMRFLLSGDTVGPLLDDDPGEGLTVGGGGTSISTDHTWLQCCTDGFMVGYLDGTGWELIGAFASTPTGITAWQATGDGSSESLAFVAGQRVRFDVVPEPATLALLGIALVGIGATRRRSR